MIISNPLKNLDTVIRELSLSNKYSYLWKLLTSIFTFVPKTIWSIWFKQIKQMNEMTLFSLKAVSVVQNYFFPLVISLPFLSYSHRKVNLKITSSSPVFPCVSESVMYTPWGSRDENSYYGFPLPSYTSSGGLELGLNFITLRPLQT